jgi:hypothetical protein
VQEHGEQIFNERAAVVDEVPHRLLELLQQQVRIPFISLTQFSFPISGR